MVCTMDKFRHSFGYEVSTFIRMKYTLLTSLLLLTTLLRSLAADTTSYVISIDHVGQSFDVRGTVFNHDTVRLVFPVWTPGYYQLMHYSQNISDFKAYSKNGIEIPVNKRAPHIWEIYSSEPQMTFEYKVKATRNFVATSYIASNYAYIMPASLIPSINRNNTAATSIVIDTQYRIETSLQKSGSNRFVASSIDELYDSPVLIGDIETLQPFFVHDKKHSFSGVLLGDFNRTEFIEDLAKIVTTASDVIGDIPYREYKFLAIGPGQGGIEHSTSTSFAFDGSHLATREGKLSMYSFLAHEYFHHYNVKRIRPIELGPFDYNRENRTNMLSVSEGATV